MRSILQEEVSVERALELQHINVKLLLKNAEALDLDPVIPVFHGWIQNQVFDELLLDVADYRHVREGPGVLVIGHEADYSVDNTDGRWGIRYNRKAVVEGNNQARLEQAVGSALRAAQLFEQDTQLDQKLCFNGRNLEVFINDRILAPNNQDTRDAAETDLHSFFHRLFADGGYSLTYEPNARRLFGVTVKSEQAFSVDQLLRNLR